MGVEIQNRIIDILVDNEHKALTFQDIRWLLGDMTITQQMIYRDIVILTKMRFIDNYLMPDGLRVYVIEIGLRSNKRKLW